MPAGRWPDRILYGKALPSSIMCRSPLWAVLGLKVGYQAEVTSRCKGQGAAAVPSRMPVSEQRRFKSPDRPATSIHESSRELGQKMDAAFGNDFIVK